MRLAVFTPQEKVLQEVADKIIAEAVNGSFALLPRHVDLVAALVPGILTYTTPGGEELFVAVDEGVLVKCGDDVRVACRAAVVGAQLGEMEATVRREFRQLDQRESRTRSTLARLEADFVRRFFELQEPRS